MIELARTTNAMIASKSELIHILLATADPIRRQQDIRSAREAQGRELSVLLEQGLNPTIAYFGALLKQSQRLRICASNHHLK